MDSTYDCKTQQNATLTGQEEEGDVQLKYLSFDLLYFDFWTILVHGSFDDSSYFVHVNINIFIKLLTLTTSGLPVILQYKLQSFNTQDDGSTRRLLGKPLKKFTQSLYGHPVLTFVVRAVASV